MQASVAKAEACFYDTTMKQRVSLLLFCCWSTWCVAQNLVPNPGFEENIEGRVTHWHQPQHRDFYHYQIDGIDGERQLFSRYQFTNGLCLITPAPSEYLTVKLKKPIQKGKTYCARMRIFFRKEDLGFPADLSYIQWSFTQQLYTIDNRMKIFEPEAIRFWVDSVPYRPYQQSFNQTFVANQDAEYLIIGRFFNEDILQRETEVLNEWTKLDLFQAQWEQQVNDSFNALLPPIPTKMRKKNRSKEIEKLNASIVEMMKIREPYLKHISEVMAYRKDSVARVVMNDQYFHTRVYFDDICIAEYRNDSCNCADEAVSIEQEYKVGNVFRLKDVYFDLDDYRLKPAAKTELDKLYELLIKYPGMDIELGGHTDSLNTESYNLTLSANRVKACADYLLSKGIGAKRLSYKGYGEAVPIASNSTEEGRAINRRVEFKITRFEAKP